MRVLVSGASGLIGSALVERLTADGHEVVRLTRRRGQAGEIYWDPVSDVPPALPEAGIDAAVHLAGENVGSGRWTERKRALIRDSRVNGARLLAAALARLKPLPGALVGASAVGYYGDRGDEVLDEQSGPGAGFLARVCRDAEAEIAFAGQTGIRAVSLRFGLVLAVRGGALAAMLPVFRMGLGGWLGSGRQYLSWIALDDAVSAVEFCLTTPSLEGPVIAASPFPVTSRAFAQALGRAVGRPALLPVPAFALRLRFGEMAREMLLASQRVNPTRLTSAGFQFRFPDLDGALRAALGQRAA